MRLAAYFRLNRCRIVNKPECADIIILIGCAFSDYREDRSFEALGNLKRYGKELIVFGCLPVASPTRFSKAFNGKWVDAQNIHLIDKLFPDFKIGFLEVPDAHDYFPSAYNNESTRANRAVSQVFDGGFLGRMFDLRRKKAVLRISNGCVGNCSYCSIKKAVGRFRSKPLEAILSEYKDLIRRDFSFFVFIGDDVGAYGLDVRTSFAELLEKMSEIDKGINVNWEIEELSPVWAVKYKD